MLIHPLPASGTLAGTLRTSGTLSATILTSRDVPTLDNALKFVPRCSMNSTDTSGEVILFAATGMSPAILTETIWALAHEEEPVIPNRVVVVTTRTGRNSLIERLFTAQEQFGGRCVWDALRDSLRESLATKGLDIGARLRFGSTAEDIVVLTGVEPTNNRSHELDDLRTREDNEAAASHLLERVRQFTADAENTLITSVAGGRKTLGALLYGCMTLAGRPQDRVTHVLVSEPYETLPDFFYPAQPGGPVKARDGGLYPPQNAKVDLADIPFVPLANLIGSQLSAGQGFASLVEQATSSVGERIGAEMRLEIETSRTEIRVSGSVIRLSAIEQSIMLLIAEAAKEASHPWPSHKDMIDPLQALWKRLRSEADPDNAGDWRFSDKLKGNVDERDITRNISSIRGKMAKAGGEAARFTSCMPGKGDHRLKMPGELIHIIP